MEVSPASYNNSWLLTTFTSVSDDERRRYLNALQARDNRLLIPTVIFLSTVAVVGLVGNSLVLLAYRRKGRQTATDVFIVAIAAFDLLTNIVALPNEIYDTFHYWDFDTPSQCRLRVYVNAFTTMTSALALLAVAVTRYKKICRPFGKQISLKTAKVSSIVIATACSLFALPQPILYGLKTRQTARPDIVGHECDIADEYLDTAWPMIFASFLMLLFLLVYFPLIVLYVLVGVQAWKHSRRHGVPVLARSQSTSDTTDNTTLYSDEATVTNISILSTKRRSLGLFLFKKRNRDTNSHQSKASSRGETHERGGEEQAKGKETDAININQSCSNRDKQSTIHVDDSLQNEMNVHPRDSEDATSTELQKLPSCLTCGDSGDNACTDGEYDSGHRSESSHSETTSQSLQVDQLPRGNAQVRGDRKHDCHSCPKGNATNEAKSCEEIHLSILGLTNPVTNNVEDLCDDSTKNNNTSSQCKSQGCDINDKTSHDHDNENKIEENNRSGLPAKARKWRSKSASQKKGHTRRVLNRTTVMLIIITTVYVVAFLPYLILISLKFTSPLFYEKLSATGESLYNLFLRFFFINSAANAIIYSICDPRFRLEIANMFQCQK